MYSTMKKLLSIILVAVMLLPMIPPIPAAADTPLLISPRSTNYLYASYATQEILTNGMAVESGWNLSTPVSEKAKIAAQWDLSTLYIAISNPDAKAVSVTLNGMTITSGNGTVGTNPLNTCTEYAVPFETLGTEISNYGATVSASVTVGNDTWSGTIVLSSIEWFATQSVDLPNASRGRSRLALVELDGLPTANQNVIVSADGLHFYDRYDEGGANPREVRCSGSYTFTQFADRSTSNVLEFTFHADAMPVYELGYDNEFYSYMPTAGFGYWMTDDDPVGKNPYMATMGIINTDVGLVFVAHNDAKDYTYVLNKYVGDTFRVTTLWNPDDSVTILIDGAEIATYQDMSYKPYFMTVPRNQLFIYNQRSVFPAESAADNFEIYITDIAVGKGYGDCITDSLRFDTIKNENAAAGEIKTNLFLPASISTPHFEIAANIVWESSDPDVIDPLTGAVTRPNQNGKTVTLTAFIEEYGVTKKFDLFVKGQNPNSDILVITKDPGTTKGAGVVFDGDTFTLDTTNNSLIRDLGEVKTVNVIVLKDGDDITRLNESMLSVWVSNDNAYYRPTDSFKILRDGAYTYIYDFTATGRYIKVHSNTHDETDPDFTGPVNGMMEVMYSDVFGDGGNAFTNANTIILKNNGEKAVYDRVYVFSPAEAGVSCVTADMADVRFYLGDELLYHYCDGEKFYVRVSKIKAGSEVTLTVLSGNPNAMNISDKEYVYEVVYGTRETFTGGQRWLTEMADGSYASFHPQAVSDKDAWFQITYDDGRTWSDSIMANGTGSHLAVPYDVLYDEESGRMLMYGSYRVNWDPVETEYRAMYSDDGGNTWFVSPIVYTNPDLTGGLANYLGMLKVSSYDGEDGPNVDYVIAVGGPDMTDTDYIGDYPENAGTTLYSTDGGKSWITSMSCIRYPKGVGESIRETAICEPTIMENDDGVLVYYARCQWRNVYHFAVAFSYDFGITWTEEATLSNIYSTNTQPIMFDFDNADMIAWGGNLAWGASTFRRYPLNVAVSYDGGITFEGIQDLYCRTAYQGMITGNRFDTTNPTATQLGDSLLCFFEGDGSYQMRIDDFADYFFLTKGAYDSFENATPEYEGWALTGGMIETADDRATDGARSMRFSVGASAVRSIPSMSNGTISFDMWIDDPAAADFSVGLQSSFTLDSAIAAPVAFDVKDGMLTFLGSTAAVDPALKAGWNTFTFTLALDNTQQSASLSVNGVSFNAPINDGAINNYVCYVHVNCDGPQIYYMDSFLVADNDEIVYVEKETAVVANELTDVPTALQAAYANTDALADTLTQLMLDEYGSAYAQNSKIMDLSLLVSTDGEQTWKDAKLSDIPIRGIEIRLDYPEGTSPETHDFKLIHMFSADSQRHGVTAGDWESPVITEKEDGLYVTMLGFSPVVLSWSDGTEAPADTASVTPVLWIGVAVIALTAAAVTVIAKKRRNA